MKPELKAGFIICHDSHGDMMAIPVRNITNINEVSGSREYTYIGSTGHNEDGWFKVKGSFFDYLELLTNKPF